ncbi:50S ribosomal protein L4, partial [Candidatus Woesearchaeota archaeon]|nr:50S ribosomal protein L4 [Candidatus Woesearchaeota archaeon]
GRKYKRKKGPLIIVSGKCSLEKAASNIPGVEVVKADNLNAELLAPGSESGRLTILTDKAIDRITSENLFTDSIIHPKEEAKK